MAIFNIFRREEEETNAELAKKFYDATSLNIADFMHGINPTQVYRNCSGTMINIFQKGNIDKRRIKKVFDKYGNQIIIEYLNDLYLRNKSILTRKTLGIIEDHAKIFGEEEISEIKNKYFNNEQITEKERYILMGLLQKCAELIDVYKYQNLKMYEDYIKSEINIGIFSDIVENGKQYSNKERKKLVKLSKYWNKDILKKYRNLHLLKQRFGSIPSSENKIKMINEILQMNDDDLLYLAPRIKDEIQELYLSYEKRNRENIINKVYEPEKKKEIIIDDLEKMGEGALIHFFGIYNRVFSFETYVAKLKKKLGRELNKEEIQAAKKSFEVKSNNFIVNKSFDINVIGQSDLGELYSVNTSNQLSTMLITPQNILKMKGVRGNLALGFAKDKLSPELITTISNRNMHSNKNIDYMETNNDFQDFSCDFEELKNVDENEANTEIVMARNTDVATLKPSYVLYISYRDIHSKEEQQNIRIYKEKMKEAGLDVPFVIFDTVTIKEKMKETGEELEV